MGNSTTIYFVRHGKVEHRDVYYGRLPDFHLSKEGFPQVEAAARALSKFHIAAIFSGPLERAVETAKIIAKQLNLNEDIQISALLNEAYSPFDGQSISVLADRNWDVYTGSGPDYEQPSDILKRAREFLSIVRKDYTGKHIVVVTHGDVIAFTVLWAKGLPITPEQKKELYDSYLSYASVSSFTFITTSENEIPKFEVLVPATL